MSAINYPDKKEYSKRMRKHHNTSLKKVLYYLNHHVKKLTKKVDKKVG